MNETFSVAVFPFLKTTAPVSLGHLVFRSTDDVAGVAEAEQKAISEIREMLFLQDNLRIRSATYAITPYVNLDTTETDTSRLQHIQALVAYLYSAPHPTFGRPFLSTEHATFIIFSLSRVPRFLATPSYHVQDVRPIDARGEEAPTDQLEGYAGLYNFTHHFWAVRDSRVYGPMPHLTLNIAQDLAADIERLKAQRHGRLLLEAIANPDGRAAQRVIKALRWYAVAGRQASDEQAAIVHLAIAFEALLGLPASEKSDRLVDSISLLLGRVPRLDEWARQFYDARSQVAHEGETDRIQFLARDTAQAPNAPQYMSLLSYGRVIFRLCVGTLLFGSDLATSAGLEELFVTNGERFVRLARMLDDVTPRLPREKLVQAAPLVQSIEHFRFANETGLRIESMVGALRRVCAAAVQIEAEMTPETRQAMAAIAEVKRAESSEFDQLNLVRRLNDAMSTPNVADLPPELDVVRSLAGSVWGYVFMRYFQLERRSVASDRSHVPSQRDHE
jgi:hypothetical protein